MEILILGPLEVVDGGRHRSVPGARVRALLARLAIDAGRPVSATALADAIWDGDPPGDEQHALQSLVSRLRRALGAPGLVAAAGTGYRLAVAPDALDAQHFAGLAGRGAARLRDGDPAAADALLGGALALWRGDLLADLSMSAALAAAGAPLAELRVSALADLARARREIGRGDELVAELQAAAAEDPLQERIAGELMRSLAAAGRQADALAAYERVRVALDAQLGAMPSPQLHEIHLAVLRGEAGPPEPPTPGSPPSPAHPGRPPAHPGRPPARSGRPPAHPGHPPARLTSFVGREPELARIGALLTSDRLITLVGPGGAGKTRLAEEVAARAHAAPAPPVTFVELAPVADGDGVAPAVLTALGLREAELLGARATAAAADAPGRLVEALHDRAQLIVLDNCEHLIADVAVLAERLLAACPALRVLATSREPLGLAGETIVPVAALAIPDGDLSATQALMVPAVRLFADRARSASPDFAVSEDTVADVVEVCRRLDGLPLAMELAAARLRAMTLSQLAARLDDRLRLLGAGAGANRTAAARQRTLRGVVDWSWELLDERERALLRRLSVFTGGVALHAAHAVCATGPGDIGTPDDVADLMSALVDKSLLTIADAAGDRHRMLETIREYASERLREAGECESTRRAHALHFAALARTAEPELRGREQLGWLTRLRADHENLLAALRTLGADGDVRRVYETVVALLWFWLLSGSRQELLTWTAFAHGMTGDADPLDRMLVDGVHGLAAAEPAGDPVPAGDPWQALAAGLDATEGADLSGHPLLAVVRPLLAVALAPDRVEELLQATAAHPDPWVRATVPFARVQLAKNAGDMVAMGEALAESLTAFQNIGDRWGEATTLSELATLRTLEGDLDGAEAALDRTRTLLGELEAVDSAAMMRWRSADLQVRRGDLPGARTLLTAALAERDRFDEETAMLQVSLAEVHLGLGEPARARELLADVRAGLRSAARRGPEQGHALALADGLAARLELQAQRPQAARPLLRDALAAALQTHEMPVVASVGVLIAQCAAAESHHEQSAELLGAAARLRGAEDPTEPRIVELDAALSAALTPAGLAAARDRGLALDRAAALARLSDATGVGAQGERDEDGEQDRHRDERPQDV